MCNYVQDLPVHPAAIRIFRSTGCCDLKEEDNGKTLSQLRFKHNEVLTVYRKSNFSSLKVPLLNRDRTELTP